MKVARPPLVVQRMRLLYYISMCAIQQIENPLIQLCNKLLRTLNLIVDTYMQRTTTPNQIIISLPFRNSPKTNQLPSAHPPPSK